MDHPRSLGLREIPGTGLQNGQPWAPGALITFTFWGGVELHLWHCGRRHRFVMDDTLELQNYPTVSKCGCGAAGVVCGSGDESTCCSSRGAQVQFPAPVWRLTTGCNSSLGDTAPSPDHCNFCTQMMHRHTYVQSSHTHQ